MRKFLFLIHIKLNKLTILVHVLCLLFYSLLCGKKLVIVSRIVGLGDVICCLPLCAQIKNHLPTSILVFITLFPFNRIIQRYPFIDYTLGTIRGEPRFLYRILRLCGIQIFNPQSSNETNFQITPKHLAFEYSESCGFIPSKTPAYLYINPSKFKYAKCHYTLTPKKLHIFIHSGRSWAIREWSQSYWQYLVKKLHTNFACQIFHYSYTTSYAASNKPVYILPETQTIPPSDSIEGITSLLSQMSLFIGIDSGLLHLAGALQVPTIGIFGATNPAFRLPLGVPSLGITHQLPCSFCHHRQPIIHKIDSCPHNIQCLRELSPDLVVNRILEFVTTLPVSAADNAGAR